MKQIRYGVFETNSSSTHSLTIFTEEQFKAFDEKKLFLDKSDWEDEVFLTKEEVIEKLKKFIESGESSYELEDLEDEDLFAEIMSEAEIYNVDTLYPNLERDETEYTSPKGEKIVIVCYYGNDS